MKRPKAFKPRRGIHFDRSIPSGPSSAFIGSSIQVTTLSGSVARSITGSSDPRDFQIGSTGGSDQLRQKLLGFSSASLGRASGLINVTTGSIPSYTNSSLGQGHGFVVPTLSSSDHESQTLNVWRSGVEALEASPVPASATLYYSKYGRYKSVIVKKTASFSDTLQSVNQPFTLGTNLMVPTLFLPGTGTLISRSGSTSADILDPLVFTIPVDVTGKIADIKVWIDLVHVSGTGASTGQYPLGNLQLSLKSPNVRWGHAHPIMNDPALKRIFTSNIEDFSTFSVFGTAFENFFGVRRSLSYLYRDTFLLWEGPFFGSSTGPWESDSDSDGAGNNYEHYVTRMYPSWQRDRSMRTVFCDGAAAPNPRHLTRAVSPSASYNGSPNSAFGINDAYGFDVPWTSEPEISGANAYAGPGSPPAGWLTGPGGTNSVNEWPTTGSNYGATHIKPFYPLLDPIYQRKEYDPGSLLITSTASAVFQPEKWQGFRPGLRGTEVSGTWQLLIADARGAAGTTAYLRQVRLEFLLVSGSYDRLPHRGNSSIRARRANEEVFIQRTSGSDSTFHLTGSWGSFVNNTYLAFPPFDSTSEIGRTVGIGFLTASAESRDFAVLVRVTGALADLSGSSPGWLLNNPFGVPQIPISSASLVIGVTEPIVGLHPQDVLTVRPILTGARRLPDAAKDALPAQSRAEHFASIISGSAT